MLNGNKNITRKNSDFFIENMILVVIYTTTKIRNFCAVTMKIDEKINLSGITETGNQMIINHPDGLDKCVANS